MKHINCIQYSEEWAQLRFGRVTASSLHRIFTPQKLELSKQADSYMYELLAESKLQAPIKQELTLWAVERGREYEQEACDFFSMTTGIIPQECGFFVTDCGRIGASPDRLLPNGEILEIKNHIANVHLEYLFAGTLPAEHRLQIQGQLYVTQFECCKLLLYHPGLPPLLVNVYPDPIIQKKLHDGLTAFCDRLDAMKQKLLAMYD